MDGIKHRNLDQIEPRNSQNKGFEYQVKEFLTRNDHTNMAAAVYTVPPLKAAFPYHYHIRREEVFFIISGQGTLRSPQGEHPISPGDLLYFPPSEKGTHQLINTSNREPLVYLDVDYRPDLDVSVYPDSGKVGVWGKNIRRVYRLEDDVDYFEGE